MTENNSEPNVIIYSEGATSEKNIEEKIYGVGLTTIKNQNTEMTLSK